jgi:hypothetical protein
MNWVRFQSPWKDSVSVDSESTAKDNSQAHDPVSDFDKITWHMH